MAALVESAEDVIDHLNWRDDVVKNPKSHSESILFTDQEKKLLELMVQQSGLGPGELSAGSGIPIQKVLSLLTEMELKRWIAVEPGNRYQAMIEFS